MANKSNQPKRAGQVVTSELPLTTNAKPATAPNRSGQLVGGFPSNFATTSKRGAGRPKRAKRSKMY